MINKFQQGGQLDLDQIFNAINSQPEQVLQLLVQSGAKPEDIIKIVQAGVLQGKINPEIGQAILQAIQGLQEQQTRAARHGSKLNYIKSLKHQCADDEELYYFKSGGKVGCGCKKKEQHGGPITKDNPSWRDKFNRRKKLQKTNQQSTNQNGNTLDRIYDPKTGKYRQVTEEDRKKWRNNLNDAKKGKGEGSPQHKCGGTVEKFKARKHQLGGSLNRVHFYLEGTSKEGILRNVYKNPQIQYYKNVNGRNPMWYRFPYPNQKYTLSDNDLGEKGTGIVFVTDSNTGSYLGGTYGGTGKKKFRTPKNFIGSLYNTWEAYADSIRNANGFEPAQNR